MPNSNFIWCWSGSWTVIFYDFAVYPYLCCIQLDGEQSAHRGYHDWPVSQLMHQRHKWSYRNTDVNVAPVRVLSKKKECRLVRKFMKIISSKTLKAVLQQLKPALLLVLNSLEWSSYKIFFVFLCLPNYFSSKQSKSWRKVGILQYPQASFTGV